MRTIIAGSRTAGGVEVMSALEACPWSAQISTVVSGDASGADSWGIVWAKARELPVERHPADWRKHGPAAGPIRNAEMVAVADALIAVWDGKSRGTADVIRRAMAAGLRVFVWNFRTGQESSSST